MKLCTTCGLRMSFHTEDMAANCAVFDISPPNAAALSEAESAPASGGPPAQAGASTQQTERLEAYRERVRQQLQDDPEVQRELKEFHEFVTSRGVGTGASVASVLLGWCNDIKRELEEFANDGPVGPMVPYRLEPSVSEQDLAALRRSLLVLTSRLHDLNSDVLDAQLRLTGRVL